eukprot:CFRG0178T1
MMEDFIPPMPDLSPEDAAATEQFMDDYISGKIPRYKDRLRMEDDDWYEQVQQVPLFMKEAPTAEQVASNPNLAALAAIVHDEGDPKDIAEYYRKQGNAEFVAGNKIVLGAKGTKKKVGGKELDDGMLESERLKHYRLAVQHYTMGVGVLLKNEEGSNLIEELDLQVTLYMNRSACHLSLGNYRKCLNDCEAAEAKLAEKNAAMINAIDKTNDSEEKEIVNAPKIEEIPDEQETNHDNSETVKEKPEVDFRAKIHFRAAKALNALRKYNEALEWCNKGLAGEPTNDAIIKLRKNIASEGAKYEKMRRKQDKETKKQAKELSDLVGAITLRNIKLCSSDTGEKSKSKKRSALEEDRALSKGEWFENPSSGKVALIKATTPDDDDHLTWPVYFLYPESGQSDFIMAFHETNSIRDHAQVILSQPAPWDVKHEYTIDNVDFFFGHTDPATDKAWLVKVDMGSPLLYVLQNPRLTIPGGLVQFVVLPKKGVFRENYVNDFEGILA